MATLDDLLKMPGVMAAGEFSADGKLVGYKAKMDVAGACGDNGPILRDRHDDVQHASRRLHAIEQDELGPSKGMGLQWG